MRPRYRYPLLAAAGVAVLGVVGVAQQPAAGLYAAAQAVNGKATYERRCAECHGADLRGSFGPELAGQAFVSAWGKKTTRELFDFLKASMPPGGDGSISDQGYVELMAYILEANKYPAGDQPLQSDATPVAGARMTGSTA